jgi:hypothetical protein
MAQQTRFADGGNRWHVPVAFRGIGEVDCALRLAAR